MIRFDGRKNAEKGGTGEDKRTADMLLSVNIMFDGARVRVKSNKTWIHKKKEKKMDGQPDLPF